MWLRRWLPPVAWMALIFVGSTGRFGSEATGSWFIPLLHALLPWADPAQLDLLHIGLRKSGHVLEYAIMAWLWFRALAPAAPATSELERSVVKLRQPALVAFAISVGYAGLDELHQAWTGARTGRFSDVLWDAAGALAALGVLRFGWPAAVALLTTVLLWIGAVGGTLFLLLTLLAGASARWLWVSAPLSWIALFCWRWLRRRAAT